MSVSRLIGALTRDPKSNPSNNVDRQPMRPMPGPGAVPPMPRPNQGMYGPSGVPAMPRPGAQQPITFLPAHLGQQNSASNPNAYANVYAAMDQFSRNQMVNRTPQPYDQNPPGYIGAGSVGGMTQQPMGNYQPQPMPYQPMPQQSDMQRPASMRPMIMPTTTRGRTY
jgi:hypothetical protein